VNPANGRVITAISEATPTDVDIAVKAARRAFEGGWGTSDAMLRGFLLNKLADKMAEIENELIALEVLDNGMCTGSFLSPVTYYSCIIRQNLDLRQEC
jgi:aldehyde dehydrogenase (NAD+)